MSLPATATGLPQSGTAPAGRTLTFVHTHRQDSLTVTFHRGGEYDQKALDQLNWFLRDWRTDETIRMDPRLFDILWDVQRQLGTTAPIHVISAYRSPATNGALRRRSGGVADGSLHMAGKAIDIRMPGVDLARLRESAIQLQHGGVGFYPGSDFVHVDTGGVRAWPRLSREQLIALFPSGRTVHLPPSGTPLAGYEQARLDVEARRASPAVARLRPKAPVLLASAGEPAGAAIGITGSLSPSLSDERSVLKALFVPPATAAASTPLMHMAALDQPHPAPQAIASPPMLTLAFGGAPIAGPATARFAGSATRPWPATAQQR